ncbi:MAG TPA: aldehyde dehydrogenase family protein, partial [Candidatus Dojkabacteria bacterium]
NPGGKDASELHDSNMPAYHEEIFGPVTSVIIVKNREQAIEIANDSEYGLGASIWTKDVEAAESYVPLLNAGAVNINKNVSSDPRLPIGGVNKSGFGRELSEYGIKEFTNIKSVTVVG